jgi:hypothetical protein
MSSSVNKTTPLLIYQPLPLAQAALLSTASQRVILVVGQSPAQGIIAYTCVKDIHTTVTC